MPDVMGEMRDFFNRKYKLSIKDWVTIILPHDPGTFFMAVLLNIEVRIIYIRLWFYKIRNRLWGMA
jgi:hypothetical protein